jgi:hypothetical protein
VCTVKRNAFIVNCFDLQINMSGAGDCTKTEAWGSNWNWTRDWSQSWGKDFDIEWNENQKAAEAMKPQVDAIEAAVKQAIAEAAANCSAAAGNATALAETHADVSHVLSTATGEPQPSSQQQQQQDEVIPDGISDGSIGTLDGARSASYNCTLAIEKAAAAAAENATSSSSSSSSVSTPLHRHLRKLSNAASSPALPLFPASTSGSILQHPQVVAALAAAAAATSNSTDAQGVVWKAAPMAAAAQQRQQQQLAFQDFGGAHGWDVGCWYCVGNNGELAA